MPILINCLFYNNPLAEFFWEMLNISHDCVLFRSLEATLNQDFVKNIEVIVEKVVILLFFLTDIIPKIWVLENLSICSKYTQITNWLKSVYGFWITHNTEILKTNFLSQTSKCIYLEKTFVLTTKKLSQHVSIKSISNIIKKCARLK